MKLRLTLLSLACCLPPTLIAQAPPPAAVQMKTVLSEAQLRPEATAPANVKSTLMSLRAAVQEKHETFTVGYTPALALPLEQLAGLRVPSTVTSDTIAQANNLAKQLSAVDAQAMAVAKIPRQISCNVASSSFDWRKVNSHLAPIRAQCCGDCFDHAANEAFDDSWAIRNNQSIETSVQYALNCFNAGTCNGGWYMPIFDKMISSGTALESTFPTNCAAGACPNVAHPYRAVAWGFVNNSSAIPTPAQIKQSLCAHGPMATAVEADSAFQAYTGGVFDEHLDHIAGLNHAITIIGWDDTKVGVNGNKGAWLIKNSWGPAWGETGEYGTSKGYMWISYNTNNIGSYTAWVDAKSNLYVLPPNWIDILQRSGIKPEMLQPVPK